MSDLSRLHGLRGWVKRFWLFMFVTAGVAFGANASAQLLLQGELDVYRAATMSITLGIVLAILMARRGKRSGKY